MAIFLRKARQQMKAGSDSKVATFAPPKYLQRDPDTDYNKLVVQDSFVDTIVRFGVPSVEYIAGIKSESIKTAKGKQKKSLKPVYKVTVKFLKVSFKEDQSDTHDVEATMGSGKNAKTMYMREPRWSTNPVQLKCQCQDFRFKFQWDLAKFGGLIGGKTKYDRITLPPTKANMKKWEAGELEKMPRDFANPTGKIGYCKHIHTLLLELKRRGWVLEV